MLNKILAGAGVVLSAAGLILSAGYAVSMTEIADTQQPVGTLNVLSVKNASDYPLSSPSVLDELIILAYGSQEKKIELKMVFESEAGFRSTSSSTINQTNTPTYFKVLPPAVYGCGAIYITDEQGNQIATLGVKSDNATDCDYPNLSIFEKWGIDTQLKPDASLKEVLRFVEEQGKKAKNYSYSYGEISCLSNTSRLELISCLEK